MTNQRLTKLLTELGLREPEAKLYLAALALGPTTILKLARTAEIKRTTLYTLVEGLKEKGLMNIDIRGFKKYFVANSPDHLVSIVNRQKERLQLLLPELASLHHLGGDGGSLKYYEGIEAVKSVYEDLLKDIKAHENYLVLTDLDQWLKLDPDFFLDFIRRRAKLPIKIRILAQPSKIAHEHKRYEKNYHETIKILPQKTTLTTNLVIIPERVVIHQLIPPIFAIVIENKSVIQMHQEQFEMIWNSIGI